MTARRFRPLYPRDVVSLANGILQAENPSAAPLGPRWSSSFRERHPELRSAMCNSITPGYTAQISAETARHHAELLDEALKEHQIETQHIYNMDKTGFILNEQGRGKVITDRVVNPKGRREKMSQQDNITAVETIRNCYDDPLPLPAFLIFKGKQMQKKHITSGVDYQGLECMHTEGGFTSVFTMLEWLDFFDEHTRPKCQGRSTWRLLMMDGLLAHNNLRVWQKAYQLQIAIVILPPNCTNWLQPLDVGVFNPLKDAYKAMLEQYNREGIMRFDRAIFMSRYSDLRRKAITGKVVSKAFAACGILPSRLDFKQLIHKLKQPERTPSPQPVDAFTSIVTPSSRAEKRKMLDEVMRLSPDASQRQRMAMHRKIRKYDDKVDTSLELALKERLKAQQVVEESERGRHHGNHVVSRPGGRNSAEQMQARALQIEAAEKEKAERRRQRADEATQRAQAAAARAEQAQQARQAQEERQAVLMNMNFNTMQMPTPQPHPPPPPPPQQQYYHHIDPNLIWQYYSPYYAQ